MKERCHNQKCKNYPAYGGRGIIVCDRWRDSFAAFLADMGPRPTPQHSIDRIDNDCNYEPGNCRWATKSEQQNNRRVNHVLIFGGETKTIAQWAKHFGLKDYLVRNRLYLGWSVENALTVPVMGKHEKYCHLPLK